MGIPGRISGQQAPDGTRAMVRNAVCESQAKQRRVVL